ncbi:MAG: hypothetical protein H7318_14260 [Oligoflexus sp.]|nr:hypothetical protein [Oligoflexus sp.]
MLKSIRILLLALTVTSCGSSSGGSSGGSGADVSGSSVKVSETEELASLKGGNAVAKALKEAKEKKEKEDKEKAEKEATEKENQGNRAHEPLYFIATQTRNNGFSGNGVSFLAPYPAEKTFVGVSKAEYEAALVPTFGTILSEETDKIKGNDAYLLSRVVYQEAAQLYSGYFNFSGFLDYRNIKIPITSAGCDLLGATEMTLWTSNDWGDGGKLYVNSMGKLQCAPVPLSCAQLNVFRVDSETYSLPTATWGEIVGSYMGMTCGSNLM